MVEPARMMSRSTIVCVLRSMWVSTVSWSTPVTALTVRTMLCVTTRCLRMDRTPQLLVTVQRDGKAADVKRRYVHFTSVTSSLVVKHLDTKLLKVTINGRLL